MSKMSVTSLTEEFLKFEYENGLFSVKIRGHLFWDYIRHYIFTSLVIHRLGSTAEENVDPARKSAANKLFLQLMEAAASSFDLLKFLVKKRHPYQIMVITDDRKNLIDGRYVEMNCYPFIKHLHSEYNMLVYDPSKPCERSHANYPCDVLTSLPFKVIDRVRALFVGFTKEEKREFAKFSNLIADKWNIKIDVCQLSKKYFAHELIIYKRYLNLFSKYHPKCVVLAHRNKGLIEAAHRSSIPVIELQHSIISKHNIHYNYPDDVRSKIKATLPDYIFTFGDFWESEFNLVSKKIPIGYPYLDLKKEETVRRNALGQYRSSKDKNMIVIGGLFSKKDLVRVTLELSERMPDHNIFYKLKLNDYVGWRQRYPEEFVTRKNIIVIDSNEIPLYDYFSVCSHQIGVNSGAVYEGLYFNLTTFILKTGWYEQMKKLYDSNYVFLVSNSDEIVYKIQSGKKPAGNLNMNAIYRQNSIENIGRALNGLKI